MQTKPSKFWAYIAVITGIFLIISGLAAAIGYFDLPVMLPVETAFPYELGNIAALYLGLFGGVMAAYHGIGSITKRKSSTFKLPAFYIFWVILGLVLGLGTLILENDIATDYLFPPLFMLGAALSTFAVIAWAYRTMGFPITWRQASLAFVSGSTLSIIVTLILGSLLYYVGYVLVEPFWYLAEEFADIGWGAPGVIERLFASPLILVFLVVTAIEAPIPEEFAKALTVPFFGRARIQNERQAFAIGLASGAGFAILENMLYEGIYAQYNGWSWGGITLLRSIGTVLHPIGAGIIALGWFRMKEGGGVGKLIKAYLLSVGLHTLWNGGFDPLVYLTGLENFTDASLSVYGETLNILLIGYLILLSIGLWILLRKIVNGISQRVTIDPTPATVSSRFIATWAVACALIVIPIGATLSPAWSAIRAMIVSGEIRQIEMPTVGTAEEARNARNKNVRNLRDISIIRPDLSGINQPGDIYYYQIELDESKPALWSYQWCASTQKILDENFENITLEFFIGDAAVPLEHFVVNGFKSKSNDLYCREYYAVINNWPTGRFQLDMHVTFLKEINDGFFSYPAGTHFYKYTVTVKQ